MTGIVYSSTSKYFSIKNGSISIPNTKRTLSLSTATSNPPQLRPNSARLPSFRKIASFTPGNASKLRTSSERKPHRKYGSFTLNTKNGKLPMKQFKIQKVYENEAYENTVNTNISPTTDDMKEFDHWLNDKNLSEYKLIFNECNIYCINDLLIKSQNEISDLSRQIIKQLPMRAKFIRAIMLKKNEQNEKQKREEKQEQSPLGNINYGMSVAEEQAMKALIGRLSYIFNSLKNTKLIISEVPHVIEQCTIDINKHFDELVAVLNSQRKHCFEQMYANESAANDRLQQQMDNIKSGAKSLLMAKKSTMENLMSCERSEIREEDIIHEIQESIYLSCFEECEAIDVKYVPNLKVMNELNGMLKDNNFGDVLFDVKINPVTVKRKVKDEVENGGEDEVKVNGDEVEVEMEDMTVFLV